MTNNRTSEKRQVHTLSRSLALTSFLTAMIAFPIPALADVPHLMSTKVAENLYMLTGDGGNIGVMIGDDGTFLIDDQMAPALLDLLALINQLVGEPPRFLITPISILTILVEMNFLAGQVQRFSAKRWPARVLLMAAIFLFSTCRFRRWQAMDCPLSPLRTR